MSPDERQGYGIVGGILHKGNELRVSAIIWRVPSSVPISVS